MKFYISVDMEGLAGTVNWKEYNDQFARFHKLATDEVLAVVNGIFNAGKPIEKICICDAHSLGHNIMFEELPRKTFLVRGAGSYLGMMQGVEEEFDGALFIGYHSKIGEACSPMDHTFSPSTFYSIKVNGEEVDEATVNAAIAGHFNTPLIMVSGDDKLINYVKNTFDKRVETVMTKKGLSRFSAMTKNFQEVLDELSKKATSAVNKAHSIKPFNFSYPCELEMALIDTLKADVVSFIPNVKRLNGRVIRYKAKDIIEVHKIITLASHLN